MIASANSGATVRIVILSPSCWGESGMLSLTTTVEIGDAWIFSIALPQKIPCEAAT